mgnify:CR=1 FL=1
MIKVAFVLEHMLAGGVETALLSLLELMPKDKFDITLYFIKAEGEFLYKIPPEIPVKELPLEDQVVEDVLRGINTTRALKRALKCKQVIKACFIVYKYYLKKDPLAKYGKEFSTFEVISQDYDVAICFHIHSQFLLRYVARNFIAKHKIAWIHNDFTSTSYDISLFKSDLCQYDQFYCVSKKVFDEFVDIVPEFSAKASIFHNIIARDKIISLSQVEFPKEFQEDNCPILVSVGRLNLQKGFDIAIDVSKILVENGIKHKWFILGEGEERITLEQKIRENGLESTFILLGVKRNPYPYIKGCTIYVQPSRHEGYGIAVAEARMLEKAIVCTDFAGAREQIVQNRTGLIVDCESQEIYKAIKSLIENKDYRLELENNLHQKNTNCKEIKELDDFLVLLNKFGEEES